jgi:hypothetical protein
VRGAIRTLEAVGFLDRWQTTGSRYKATEHGLRRKPIPFTFGAEYMPLLLQANRWSAARRSRDEQGGRAASPAARKGPTAPRLQQPCYLPKDKSAARNEMLMGKISTLRPQESNPNLEAALARLAKAIGEAGAARTARGSREPGGRRDG